MCRNDGTFHAMRHRMGEYFLLCDMLQDPNILNNTTEAKKWREEEQKLSQWRKTSRDAMYRKKDDFLVIHHVEQIFHMRDKERE